MPSYSNKAYAPSKNLWWNLQTWPNKRVPFGAEPKLAAWLQFNAKTGDKLTLRKLRAALGEADRPVDHEHFNRRFRELRKYDWLIYSNRDDASLKQDEYRVISKGKPIWLGKAKFCPKAISAKVRRQVLDNDGHRCVVCGIGAGEPYPEDPGVRARLTIGHFKAGALRGRNADDNLRTECSRCNEPAREEVARSENSSELGPKLRSLRKNEKIRILRWITHGYRVRDDVDVLYDQYRGLPAPQREQLRAQLEQAVTGVVGSRKR